MGIRFKKKEAYDISNEGLLSDVLVDGEKMTCVTTREVLWESPEGNQILSLQAAFEVGQERTQDAVCVLIADGAQRSHGLEDLPQPIVVKRAHTAVV